MLRPNIKDLLIFHLFFYLMTELFLLHTLSPGHCPNADGCEETGGDNHPTPATFWQGLGLRHPPACLKLLLLGDH